MPMNKCCSTIIKRSKRQCLYDLVSGDLSWCTAFWFLLKMVGLLALELFLPVVFGLVLVFGFYFSIALCRSLIVGLECQSFLASESQFHICQLVMWNQLLFLVEHLHFPPPHSADALLLYEEIDHFVSSASLQNVTNFLFTMNFSSCVSYTVEVLQLPYLLCTDLTAG